MKRLASRLLGNRRKLVAAAVLCTLAWLGLGPAALPVQASSDVKLEPIVVGQPQKIEVEPQTIDLSSPRREMHVVVTGQYAGGTVQDLTRVAAITAADSGIVAVEHGVVRPLADGQTHLSVTVGGYTLRVPVRVSGQQAADPVSFNYGALVALTKQGCNQGACHGSPSGKGGFRLSLRAYDPVLDTET
ncbi:MAG TPA: hypothetical protein VIK18_25090, partial [Pirellulales bacterium]